MATDIIFGLVLSYMHLIVHFSFTDVILPVFGLVRLIVILINVRSRTLPKKIKL